MLWRKRSRFRGYKRFNKKPPHNQNFWGTISWHRNAPFFQLTFNSRLSMEGRHQPAVLSNGNPPPRKGVWCSVKVRSATKACFFRSLLRSLQPFQLQSRACRSWQPRRSPSFPARSKTSWCFWKEAESCRVQGRWPDGRWGCCGRSWRTGAGTMLVSKRGRHRLIYMPSRAAGFSFFPSIRLYPRPGIKQKTRLITFQDRKSENTS